MGGKWLRSHKDRKCDVSLELLQQVNPSSQEPEPVIIPVKWLTALKFRQLFSVGAGCIWKTWRISSITFKVFRPRMGGWNYKILIYLVLVTWFSNWSRLPMNWCKKIKRPGQSCFFNLNKETHSNLRCRLSHFHQGNEWRYGYLTKPRKWRWKTSRLRLCGRDRDMGWLVTVLYLISSSSSSAAASSSSLPLPTPSLLSHSYFQRCLVSLTPVMVPLPFSVVQERRREAPAHHHHVPRGPSLACSSCCSVQLLLSIRPRPAGLVDSVRAEPLWARASRLPRHHRDRGSISRWPASPFPLRRSSLWVWPRHLRPRYVSCPCCFPCSAWHRQLSREAAHHSAGAPLPCYSVWSLTKSPAFQRCRPRRVRTWRKCEYDGFPVCSVNLAQSCCWTCLQPLSLCFLVS